MIYMFKASGNKVCITKNHTEDTGSKKIYNNCTY